MGTSVPREEIEKIRVKQSVTINTTIESMGDAIDLLRAAFDLVR